MAERITKRNYFGTAFVPGYAPKCKDASTCELLVKLTERVAAFEDMLEYPGILDSMPQEVIEQLEKKGAL